MQSDRNVASDIMTMTYIKRTSELVIESKKLATSRPARCQTNCKRS
jgi:hypothetical protein